MQNSILLQILNHPWMYKELTSHLISELILDRVPIAQMLILSFIFKNRLMKGLTKLLTVEVPALISTSWWSTLFEAFFSKFIISFPQVLILQNLIGTIDFKKVFMSWWIILNIIIFIYISSQLFLHNISLTASQSVLEWFLFW